MTIIKSKDNIKERDYVFDNLKGLLLILVVLGHIIENIIYRSTGVAKYFYTAIYIFHMPIFIFISGYFSKKHNLKRILSLIAVYTLWQLLICPLCLSIFTNKSFSDLYKPLYSPQYTYWYLLALIIWKLLIPYLNKIKYIVPISIIVSLCFGFIQSDFNLQYFTTGRLFVFFPFFLLGYKCDKDTITKWIASKKSVLNSIIFTLLIITLTIFIHYVNSKYGVNTARPNRILMPHYYYYECYTNSLVALITKTLILIVQLCSIPLAFKIISNKPSFISNIGRYSLFIYLSHAIVLTILKTNYIKNLTFTDANMFFVCCIIFSILYCFILSINPIGKTLDKITNLKFK